MRYSDLVLLAEAAPACDKDELLELAARTKEGEAAARDLLTMVLLPQFCSEYRFQAGPQPEDPDLLNDCLARFLQLVTDFDFRQSGESFADRLSRQIRQARADRIAAATPGIPCQLDGLPQGEGGERP